MTGSHRLVTSQADLDAATEHTYLRTMLMQITERCQDHRSRDSEIRAWMDDARTNLTRIKTAAYVAVVLAGGAIAVARWAISHAVTDALVEHGLLKVQHPAALAETPTTGG